MLGVSASSGRRTRPQHHTPTPLTSSASRKRRPSTSPATRFVSSIVPVDTNPVTSTPESSQLSSSRTVAPAFLLGATLSATQGSGQSSSKKPKITNPSSRLSSLRPVRSYTSMQTGSREPIIKNEHDLWTMFGDEGYARLYGIDACEAAKGAPISAKVRAKLESESRASPRVAAALDRVKIHFIASGSQPGKRRRVETEETAARAPESTAMDLTRDWGLRPSKASQQSVQSLGRNRKQETSPITATSATAGPSDATKAQTRVQQAQRLPQTTPRKTENRKHLHYLSRT